jgi:PPOX class probable F420-dependent enzyme
MMKLPASHVDLLDAPGIASLSTLGADGYPRVTAIWFMRDGETIVTSLMTTRQKYKNGVRHPNVTLFIIDPKNPYRTVEIRGDLTSEDDPGLETMRRVVTHHGEAFDSFPAPKHHRVKVTITPPPHRGHRLNLSRRSRRGHVRLTHPDTPQRGRAYHHYRRELGRSPACPTQTNQGSKSPPEVAAAYGQLSHAARSSPRLSTSG